MQFCLWTFLCWFFLVQIELRLVFWFKNWSFEWSSLQWELHGFCCFDCNGWLRCSKVWFFYTRILLFLLDRVSLCVWHSSMYFIVPSLATLSLQLSTFTVIALDYVQIQGWLCEVNYGFVQGWLLVGVKLGSWLLNGYHAHQCLSWMWSSVCMYIWLRSAKLGYIFWQLRIYLLSHCRIFFSPVTVQLEGLSNLCLWLLRFD